MVDLFEKITLFENRALTATYQARADGGFDVRLEAEVKKVQADSEGRQTEVSADDWIEVGALARPARGRSYGKTLYRERMRMASGRHVFEFIVAEPPDQVGIDPFALLIDRIPDDNTRRAREKSAETTVSPAP